MHGSRRVRLLLRRAVVYRASSIILAVLALVATAGHTSHAATYWVATSGNDAGPGTEAAPWRTLQRAAGAVGAGDTVLVADGDYQGFDLRRSGTAAHPITFRANGSNVRISTDNPITPDGINVENAAHVIIDGFIVDGRTRAGVRAALAQFITVRNCRLGYNGKWGILTGFVDDLLVENNEAHHSVLEHGIYASNSGDRPLIRNNWVHDNRANGIHINSDASQGGDGIISGALVEGNVIHGNGVGGGSGINMDGVVDSVVRNNLLYDNHASGISLYRIDGATGSTNNLVINNTIIQASDGRWSINIRDGSTGNRVFNNILYTTHSFRGVITIDAASRPGFVSDYNSVRSRFSIDGGNSVIDLAAWQALGHDLHSFVATPADHFVTPGSDFHLRADSPAIDTGTAAGAPPFDLDGVARPQGAGIDLGAFERPVLVPSPTPTAMPPAPTASLTRTGTATRTATPTATPAPSPATVGGQVRYYQGGAPVGDVNVMLIGAGVHQAVTGADGSYTLADVPAGLWRLQPQRSGGSAGSVTALDAAWVLQHVTGLRALDAEQQLACDVTANGSLSPLDASRILQHAVGLLEQLPAAEACASDWLFMPAVPGQAPSLNGGHCLPGAIDYPNLAGNLTGQDFRAAVIGDCTGNWAAGGQAVRRRAGVSARVRLRRVGRERTRLALLVDVGAPVQALEATLTLTPPKARLLGVRPAGSTRNGHVAANQISAGRVLLAFAAARPIAASRRLAFVLEFAGPPFTRAQAVRIVADE